jgi:hypothetical protein
MYLLGLEELKEEKIQPGNRRDSLCIMSRNWTTQSKRLNTETLVGICTYEYE